MGDSGAAVPPPVFVLAPPRSCSTVVTAMFGGHPQLYALPEMKLFRRPTVAKMLDDWPSARSVPIERRRAGLLRGMAQILGGAQNDETIERARSWLDERRDWDGGRLLEWLTDELAPQVVVEKSPENCARQEYLDRLLRRAPQARFLHLVRHPVESASSLHEVWSSPSAWDLSGAARREFDLGVWLFNHRRIDDVLATLPAHRWRRVRAEDLVNNPTGHLPELLDWLGVRSDADAIAAMIRTETWAFASNGPESAPGGGDTHFLASPVLHPVTLPTTVRIPRDWSVDPWTSTSVLELAGRFGYR